MTDQVPQAGRDPRPSTPSYPPRHPGLKQPDSPGQQGHQRPDDSSPAGHGGHRWMMIACCIPMLVIVGVLVATGVAGTGAILYAVICLGMMALMMFAMPGGHRH